MSFKHTILFFITFLSAITVFAQKRTLGYPESFKNPLDPYDQNKYETFIRGESIDDKDNKRAWWVIIDRDNVKAYDSPNKGNQVTTLKFSTPYYVVKENNDWVQIADGTVDKLEIKKLRTVIGWVNKNDVLLWNESLINPRTKIHLKALLLNKYDDFKNIPCDKKELVKVYNSPTGSSLKDNLNIYKFYFVYKKEGERYLLGETSGLSYYNPDFLLGWVEKGRVADWNTRIALEPNFTEEGYRERKNNPAYQVVGFEDALLAEDFGAGRGPVKGDWSRDPVITGQDVADSDPKRFPGGFMRFPLLSVGGQTKKSILPYFKSAVCDNIALKVKCQDGKVIDVKQMPIGKHVKVGEAIETYTKASKHFNVFFVIEGSGALSGFKENIVAAIDEVKSAISSNSDKPTIKFGALIYKDVAEMKGNASPQSLVQQIKLTPDQQSVKDWIRRATFSNPNSSGEYPVQYYGLYKAIEAAEFNKNETNIIIVLGQKGDFTKDALMRKQYAGKSFNVTNASIEDLIVKNNVNIFAIQCIGGNSETDRGFTSSIQSVVLQSARRHFNNIKTKKEQNKELRDAFSKINYEPKSPTMEDPDETKSSLLTLENGTLSACIFRTFASGAITQETFIKMMSAQCGLVTKQAVEFASQLDKWNYQEIDGSGFSAKMGEVLAELYENQKLDDSFTDDKYELYKPMYFNRQPQGAKNPTFSFVLFWPEGDLRKYNAFLEKLLVDVSNISTGQKRIKLQETYCKLLDEFAGGESGKDCTEYTIEEIIELIQGVKGEGLDFSSKCIRDKPLKCLVDKNCTSDEEVEGLIRCFTGSKKILERLLSNYDKEDFVFNRGGEYFFWIKLSDLF